MGLYPKISIASICLLIESELFGTYNYDVEGDWSGILASVGAACPNSQSYVCLDSSNHDSTHCDVHYLGTLSDGSETVRTVFVTKGCTPCYYIPQPNVDSYNDIPSAGTIRWSRFALTPGPLTECGVTSCDAGEIFPSNPDPEGITERDVEPISATIDRFVLEMAKKGVPPNFYKLVHKKEVLGKRVDAWIAEPREGYTWEKLKKITDGFKRNIKPKV